MLQNRTTKVSPKKFYSILDHDKLKPTPFTKGKQLPSSFANCKILTIPLSNSAVCTNSPTDIATLFDSDANFCLPSCEGCLTFYKRRGKIQSWYGSNHVVAHPSTAEKNLRDGQIHDENHTMHVALLGKDINFLITLRSNFYTPPPKKIFFLMLLKMTILFVDWLKHIDLKIWRAEKKYEIKKNEMKVSLLLQVHLSPRVNLLLHMQT